jgi:hypothetical protein
MKPIHTSDRKSFDKSWLFVGGHITPITGTGELRYTHDKMPRPVRINGRRPDVPAILLSRINQIIRRGPANDPTY